MSFSLQAAGFLILFLWLLGLTFLILKLQSHYNSLLEGTNKKQLQEILNLILEKQNENKKHLAELMTRCDKIESEGKIHIQKIGLIRFNPFKDTGGNQSFILALVNAQDSGIVISGLYSRSGTRWYAKQIVEGKGLEHELSEEEKKALKAAVANYK